MASIVEEFEDTKGAIRIRISNPVEARKKNCQLKDIILI
jgi:hypothetical protein